MLPGHAVLFDYRVNVDPSPAFSLQTRLPSRIMAINAKSVLAVSQVAARDMIARGKGGAIVTVSSQASMVGIVDHASYCESPNSSFISPTVAVHTAPDSVCTAGASSAGASKGAVDQLTRVMAAELGPHKVRATPVSPHDLGVCSRLPVTPGLPPSLASHRPFSLP